MALKENDIVGCILTLEGYLTLKPVFACRYCSLLKVLGEPRFTWRARVS